MQNSIQHDVRELFAAVLDAIDIPLPATAADGQAHDRLLSERAALAVTVARAALTENPDSIGWNADYLCTQLAQLPPTDYRHYDDKGAGQ